MTITVEAYTGAHLVQSTEWSMTGDAAGPGSVSTSGILQAFIDLSALTAGDVYEFRVYEVCRTGDTQRAVYSARFANAQSTPLWVSPALVMGVGWDMTLRKIGGTDRQINWRISKVA